MLTKRIEYIDAMQGFTMTLVVFSHILLSSYFFNACHGHYLFNP